MHKLQNIPVKKLFRLPLEKFEAYNNALRHIKGKPLFRGHEALDIGSLKYKDVSFIRKSLEKMTLKGITKSFALVFGIKTKRWFWTEERMFFQARVVEFYQALNWILSEIENIEEQEKKLSRKPNDKLKEAGIERLGIFEELNTFIALGERFGLPPQKIQNWKYNLVFALSLHSKVHGEIQDKYADLLKPSA